MNRQSSIKAAASLANPLPVVPCGISGSPIEARAPAIPKMKCLECDGEGEAEYLALDAIRPHWDSCHVCHGTGLVAPYCETCEGKLTVDGFCYDCSDYAEGFAPSGWLKAETCAFGMPGVRP